MSTVEQPITRSELRAELDSFRSEFQRMLEHYATKEDLANLKADLRGDFTRLVVALAGLQLAGLAAVAAIMRFLAS